MSRRSRNDNLPGFAALKGFQARSTRASGRRKTPAASRQQPAEPDVQTLLADALSGVTPLPQSDRAELEMPKPTPRPRPKTVETEDDRAATRPSNPGDPWLEALEGVRKLAPANRVLNAARLLHRVNSAAPVPVAARPAQAFADPLLAAALGDVQPLADTGRIEVEKPKPAAVAKSREEDARNTLRETLETPLSFEDRLDMGHEPAFLQAGIRRSVLTDLRRGRWIIQAELDLHGLTREEARTELSAFLHRSLQQGLRCLRVIHGKGLRSPGKESILRQLSRSWLAQREEILAFCQARPHDGGEGALIVLLRAARPPRAEGC